MIMIKLALCAMVFSLTGSATSEPAPAPPAAPEVSVPDAPALPPTDEAPVALSCQDDCNAAHAAEAAFCIANYVGNARGACLRAALAEKRECLAGC